MGKVEYIQFWPRDHKLVKKFAQFGFDFYKDDPVYVHPLKMDFVGNKLLGVKGLLMDDHPFHKHAKVTYFMALEDGRPVGRISASIDYHYNEYHDEKAGFFGFFECINDKEIAHNLLKRAESFLREEGMTRIYGPANFTSNHTWGLLIENFEDIPYMETVYNPPYYKDLIESAGYQKAMDIIAQLMPVHPTPEVEHRHERLERIAQRIREKGKIWTRTIDFKRLEEDARLIHMLYNEAWKNNWGFVPLVWEEFWLIAQNLKIIADPNLVIFAYYENEPAGFIASFPDVNIMIKGAKNDLSRLLRIFTRKRKVPRIRLMLAGIAEKYRKHGVDAILYYESFNGAFKNKYYQQTEISWLLETNRLIISAGHAMGGKEYKRWRIYYKDL